MPKIVLHMPDKSKKTFGGQTPLDRQAAKNFLIMTGVTPTSIRDEKGHVIRL